MSGRLLLVRHGQSYGNIDRRLDTRPPGAELTPLGREQARNFARLRPEAPRLLVHSLAVRAVQTATEMGDVAGIGALEVDGIHEVQAGDLEGRNDDAAHDEFRRVCLRWHLGELDVPMPGGESGAHVLDRFVPVLTELRLRYLDDESWTGDIVVVSHGAAIRLVASALSGVDRGFAADNHLANTDAVALAPIADGRWSCVQWGALVPPFAPEPPDAPESSGAAEPPVDPAPSPDPARADERPDPMG